MSDRVDTLIADVQANISPCDRLPQEASERWPGIAVLDTKAVVEVLDTNNESPWISDDDQRLDRVEKIEWSGLRDDVQYVSFPEHINGQVVLDEAEETAGIESLDALAFYLPFHFYRKWGIYIREGGLLALAGDLAYVARRNGCTTVTPSQVLDYAYRILWSHEFFHFQTEVACARLQHPHPPSDWLYSRYFTDQAAGFNEEALANAYALMCAKRLQTSKEARAMQRAARAFMRGLGPGYRDYAQCERSQHALSKDDQVDRMAAHGIGRQTRSLVPGRLLYRDILGSNVPTFLVRDGGDVVSLLRQFPSHGPLKVWVYTNDHRPPHVHTGSGPSDPQSKRFEWPSRTNMDGASAKVVTQFSDYADRYSVEISKKVSKIDWK